MKRFLIRIGIYIFFTITLFLFTNIFQCSLCSVGNMWCLSDVGYGGINLLAIVKWFLFLAVVEIYLLFLFKKFKGLRKIVLIGVVFIYLVLFSMNSGRVYDGCQPCAVAYDCILEKEDWYVCKFMDDDKEYNIKCHLRISK